MARVVAVVVALSLATVAVAAASGSTSHPRLIGTVGKNGAYRITLTSNGKLVKTLKAGTYTFVIRDDASIHNYELDGPHGKSWTFTSPSYVGTKTITLKLTPGEYKAYCAPHESMMFEHFTVAA